MSQTKKPGKTTGQYDLFGGTPPHVRNSPTSKAAAESVRGSLGNLQRQVLFLIRRAGARGMTCDELEVALDGRHQTISARVRELYLKGLIVKFGERPTRSGRRAVVYKPKERAT